MVRCEVCFRHCFLKEGQMGFCGARECKNGQIIAANYGRITALALDPIEKKPLKRFYPGSKIISVGSYGCNLRCPYCQNCEISWSEKAMKQRHSADIITPEELVNIAMRYKDNGNIGIAFTYNEPLIGYEFIKDTAKLIHQVGMKNVLVTNGTAELWVLDELAPYIDAMNIDLKGFSESFYNKTLGGDINMTKDFIKKAVSICHVELTTLIVTYENDTVDEIRKISEWISDLTDKNGKIIGKKIPLHITRFFPRFMMKDREATNIKLIYELSEAAREKLEYVYTGNC